MINGITMNYGSVPQNENFTANMKNAIRTKEFQLNRTIYTMDSLTQSHQGTSLMIQHVNRVTCTRELNIQMIMMKYNEDIIVK